MTSAVVQADSNLTGTSHSSTLEHTVLVSDAREAHVRKAMYGSHQPYSFCSCLQSSTKYQWKGVYRLTRCTAGEEGADPLRGHEQCQVPNVSFALVYRCTPFVEKVARVLNQSHSLVEGCDWLSFKAETVNIVRDRMSFDIIHRVRTRHIDGSSALEKSRWHTHVYWMCWRRWKKIFHPVSALQCLPR